MSALTLSAAVAAGGGIGALGRFWLSAALAGTFGPFPLHTLVVNVVGCALIGGTASYVAPHAHAYAFLVAGVLGGFTTYSAFALDTVRLAEGGRPVLAAVYAGTTLGTCLAGALAGALVGKALA